MRRFDKAQLEAYVDRLHEETAAWTKDPLTSKEAAPDEEELE